MQVNAINQGHFKTSEIITTRQPKGSVFSSVLAGYQKVDSSVNDSGSHVAMDTNHGNIQMDLDNYFDPETKTQVTSGNFLDQHPLLLPTAHNINALSEYSEQQFNALLSQYDIPQPPATLEFDQEGNLVLPNDYAYADQLKKALDDNPKVEKVLRTTAALASHYAGMLEGQPFRDEMSTARNQADRDRIVAKYSYLFDDNRPAKHIIFHFLEDGSLLLGEKQGEDGKGLFS